MSETWIKLLAEECCVEPNVIDAAHAQGCEAQRQLDDASETLAEAIKSATDSICDGELHDDGWISERIENHLTPAFAKLSQERDEAQRHFRELSESVFKAHQRGLPENWEYTDPQTSIDLLLAELSTTRKERDEAQRELKRLHDAITLFAEGLKASGYELVASSLRSLLHPEAGACNVLNQLNPTLLRE